MIFKIKLERDELHRKIGGGIPEGAILLLEGEEGAGKSVVSQRFTYGLLKKGTKVTYISSEMDTKGFIKQMSSFNYDILDYLFDFSLLFIPVFPVTAKHVKGNLLKRLMSAGKLYENNVIVIDCISHLVGKEISNQEANNFVQFLKEMASLKKSFIITADPSITPENFLSLMRNMSDAYIRLEKKMIGSQIKRFMVVERYGGTKERVSDVIGFRVEPGIGFILDISVMT
ncbi:MAG TPA: ATPase [Candidatus Aenigmarchaeota archaeon]|nr:ATPase [Candidatus Aenigmarchaeota archaeon]